MKEAGATDVFSKPLRMGWILGQCLKVAEMKREVKTMVRDEGGCIVVSQKTLLMLFENHIRVVFVDLWRWDG